MYEQPIRFSWLKAIKFIYILAANKKVASPKPNLVHSEHMIQRYLFCRGAISEQLSMHSLQYNNNNHYLGKM